METRTGHRTSADMTSYIIAAHRGMWGGNWKSWRIWVVSLLPYILGVSFSVLFYLATGPDAPIIEAYIIGGFFGAAGAYISNCHIAPRLRKNLNIYNGPFVGELKTEWDDKFITTRCNEVSYSSSWGAVRSLARINDTLILYTDVTEGLIIPVSAFDTEDDLQAFIDFVESKLKAKDRAEVINEPLGKSQA